MNKDIEKLIITEDSTKEYIERRNNERLEALDEASNDSNNSKTITMIEHMLKYKYIPSRQTRSWITIIYRDHKEVSEAVHRSTKNLVNYINSNMDKNYTEAVDRVIDNNDTNTDLSIIPRNNKDDNNNQIFTLDNLLNKEWVDNYLVTNMISYEAKRELTRRGML